MITNSIIIGIRQPILTTGADGAPAAASGEPPRTPPKLKPSGALIAAMPLGSATKAEGVSARLVVNVGEQERTFSDVMRRAAEAGLNPSELAQLRQILEGLPPGKAGLEMDLLTQLLDGPGPKRALQAYLQLDADRRRYPDRLDRQMTQWICEAAGLGLLGTDAVEPNPVGHERDTVRRVAYFLVERMDEPDLEEGSKAGMEANYRLLRELLAHAGGNMRPPADPQLERAILLREFARRRGSTYGLSELANRIRGANPEDYYLRKTSPFAGSTRDVQSAGEIADASRDPETRLRETLDRLAKYGLSQTQIAEIEKLIRTHPGSSMSEELKLVQDLLDGRESLAGLQTYVGLAESRSQNPGRLTPELVRYLCEGATRPLSPSDKLSDRVNRMLNAAGVICRLVSQDYGAFIMKLLRHAGEDGGSKSDAVKERAYILRMVVELSDENQFGDRSLIRESADEPKASWSLWHLQIVADAIRGKDADSYPGRGWNHSYDVGPADARLGKVFG